MVSKLKQWFASPIFEGDEEKIRRTELTRAVIITIFIWMALGFIGNLAGGRTPQVVLVLNIFLLMVCTFMYFSLRRGMVTFAGIGMLSFAIVLITGAIINLGTIRTPTAAIYMLVVIVSGLLFEKRGVLITATLNSLIVCGLIVVENMGILPIPDYSVNVTQWVAYTVYFGMAGSLILFAMQAANQALARAKKEIEERRQAERQNVKLENAIEHLADIVFITNNSGSIEYVNPAFEFITGYGKDEAIGKTPRILSSGIMEEGYSQKLWETILSGKVFRSEIKNKKKNGELFYYDQTITPVMDEHRKITHFISTGKDVTERKQMEDALAAERRRLSGVIKGTNAGTWEWNIQTGETKLDERWAEIVGYSLEEITPISGNIWRSAIHPDDLIRSDKLLQQHFNKESDYYEAEVRMHHKNGQWVWVQSKGKVTAWTNDDKPLLMFGTHQDITVRKMNENLLEEANQQLILRIQEVEQLQEELREQTIRDPLTGTYNRRYMQDIFVREFSRAAREKYPVSVIMLDMDDLKNFNDTYGHHAGDLAIQALTTQIQNMIRGEDVICRYGGDEFVIILSKTNPQEALKRINEWRESLNNHLLDINGEKKFVKFTAGIAGFPMHGIAVNEVVNYADVALYRAKLEGRNRTVVFK